MLDYAWLIPLITAVSFFVILFFGKRMPFKGAEVGISALLLCFFLAVACGATWINRPADLHVSPAHAVVTAEAKAEPSTAHQAESEPIRAPVQRETIWFKIGQTEVKAGIHIDGLAVVLLFVVSLISLLVHIFSFDYMHGDERFTHYFAGLSLFTTGMFVLVTASNTLQALFGWELMGLCSFMLIGHWWDRDGNANSNAAMKAFFTTRTGDVGLLVGISILFFGAGRTFDIATTNANALSGQIGHGVVLAAAIALLCAVIGKSAQFPLHTWLPDAMAGPTPVSALIHAATMVVAGVYLVARLYGVFWEGFHIAAGGINPVALVGGITIIIAAALAFVQNDIKKVLAYSTVSQLGYMVMALGVGAWTGGVFHLFTHAFFKACLFLGAGSIAHSGSHHSFDMVEDMGGLKDKMPWTFRTFVIASIALAGVPPLAGFWSKDEILVGAWGNGYQFFMIVGLIGAFMTAAYMTRCIYLTFFGEPRGNAAHHHPHESPPFIVVPLQILAVLSVFAGLLNFPMHGAEWFGKWTSNTAVLAAGVAPHDFSWVAAGISVAVALGGGLTAYAYFWRGFRIGVFRHDEGATGIAYRFLVQKYRLDDLYEGIIVRGIREPIAQGAYWINQNVIDGAVNGVAILARALARFVYEFIDQRVVDGLVNGSGFASETGGAFLRRSQTGKVAQYAAAMVVSTLAFAGVLLYFV